MLSISSAENLLFLFYGLCFSVSAGTQLATIFPRGIGQIHDSGIKDTLLRAVLTSMYMISNAFFLVFAIFLVKHFLLYNNFLSSGVSVLFITFLSLGPWFCDHLSRFVFDLPFKTKWIRERQYRFVDRLYIIVYLFVLVFLFGVEYLVRLLN